MVDLPTLSDLIKKNPSKERGEEEREMKKNI